MANPANPVFNSAVYQNGALLGAVGSSASAVTDPLLTALVNAGAIVDISVYDPDNALFSTVMTVDAEGDFIGQYLGTPILASISKTSSGGTLAAATYYYVVPAVNAQGETTASNELSIAVTGTTSTITIQWVAPAAPVPAPGQPAGLGLPTDGTPTGYNVYRGTAAGGENNEFVTGTTTLSFTDTGAAATHTSTAPPTHNAATLPGEVVKP